MELQQVRIGIDASRTTRDIRTGTENYSLHLIKAMLEVEDRNTFHLYFNQAPDPGLIGSRPNVQFQVMPAKYLWTHSRLATEVTLHPPDVLFVPAHVLPWRRRCPSVVTVHDLGYLAYPSAHRRPSLLYLQLGTLFSVRKAARVISVSQATKRDLVAKLGVSPDKICVIPEAPTPGLAPLPNVGLGHEVARGYGVEPPYVIALGSVHPRKNLTRLVKAFARAKVEAGLPHRLAIVGSVGYRADEVRAAAHHSGVERHVVLTGYVPAGDLPLLLGAAEALAFPSLYEGFGLPALEAMASGVPVVASNSTSLPEVVGDAGLLVDPRNVGDMASALADILTDTSLRKSLMERGLARARLFTWERAARETLAVLAAAA